MDFFLFFFQFGYRFVCLPAWLTGWLCVVASVSVPFVCDMNTNTEANRIFRLVKQQNITIAMMMSSDMSSIE